jgi:hypothetical protein
MAYGADKLRLLLPIPPRTLLSAGLLVALASGALAFFSAASLPDRALDGSHVRS